MTNHSLPRIALAIINHVAPEEWRDSLIGDLQEERQRRIAAHKYAGIWWVMCAAFGSSFELRREQRRPVTAMAETSRSALNGIARDIRHTIRSLRKRPGFAVVAVLTLTLGIGASTAVFALANWLILRPVPGVDRPDQLMTVRLEFPSGGFYTMSVKEMQAIAAVPAFSVVGASTDSSFHVVLGSAAPIRVSGGVVTSNYFSVLGQRVTMGRAFGPGDDTAGDANVAIVSDKFWRSELAGDRNVIGRQLTLNGHPFTVIGVAAKGFRGPDRSGSKDLWVPLASFRASMPSMPPTMLTGNAGIFFSLLGRVKDGHSLEAVQAQLKSAQVGVAAASKTPGKYKRASFTARPGLDVPAWQRNGLRQMFALLLTVAGLILVLTCANAANLLFARAHERYAELATRQALGASRGRVIRLMVLEGLLLSIASGALAIGAAVLLGSLLDGLVIARNLPALSSIGVDWRVFAFTLGLAAVTCVVASLMPAIVGSRVDLISALKASGRGQTPSGRRVRRVLTAVQVAVAVSLLTVGGLLVRSMLARYNVPLGYDAQHTLAFSIDADVQGYDETRLRQLFNSTLDAMRNVPGVSHAGMAWIEPFRAIGSDIDLARADATGPASVSGDRNLVSTGFFNSLGARFVDGRDFTQEESFRKGNPKEGIVILNQTMARSLFGDASAVGRQLVTPDEEKRVFTVVGVVSDIRTRDVSYEPIKPTAYEPYGQAFLSGWGSVHLRINASAADVIPRVREAMRAVDAQIPIYDVELLSDAVNRHLAESRLLSRTIAGFAILATLVAALGLYGVLARSVEERRREFSIRTALGAGPLSIGALVTREALQVSIVGSLVGVGGALILSRYVQARLFGVESTDPTSFGLALSVVLAIAIASAFVPARRAARVDVVNELR